MKFREWWPVLCFVLISLMILIQSANAQCRGGGCNQQSQSAASQNDDLIREQELQIDDLSRRIEQLTSTLNRIEAARGLVQRSSVETLAVADRDERIVNIGRDDSPARIQPIQLVQTPRSISVRAPGVRVQTGITPRPRTSTRSQWNR